MSYDPNMNYHFIEGKYISTDGKTIVYDGNSWQLFIGNELTRGFHSWRIKINDFQSNENDCGLMVGVCKTNSDRKSSLATKTGYGYILKTGHIGRPRGISVPYGKSFGVGDVITILLHLGAGTLSFALNDVSQGIAYRHISPPVCISVASTAPCSFSILS